MFSKFVYNIAKYKITQNYCQSARNFAKSGHTAALTHLIS